MYNDAKNSFLAPLLQVLRGTVNFFPHKIGSCNIFVELLLPNKSRSNLVVK